MSFLVNASIPSNWIEPHGPSIRSWPVPLCSIRWGYRWRWRDAIKLRRWWQWSTHGQWEDSILPKTERLDEKLPVRKKYGKSKHGMAPHNGQAFHLVVGRVQDSELELEQGTLRSPHYSAHTHTFIGILHNEKTRQVSFVCAHYSTVVVYDCTR
jgi:hypothetical protein